MSVDRLTNIDLQSVIYGMSPLGFADNYCYDNNRVNGSYNY